MAGERPEAKEARIGSTKTKEKKNSDGDSPLKKACESHDYVEEA